MSDNVENIRKKRFTVLTDEALIDYLRMIADRPLTYPLHVMLAAMNEAAKRLAIFRMTEDDVVRNRNKLIQRQEDLINTIYDACKDNANSIGDAYLDRHIISWIHEYKRGK